MPTGYTAGVGDGTVKDFEDFALSCARNFGALIMMRDDPSDAPIPDEFKPSDYHARALEKTKAEIAALEKMTEAECEAAAAEKYKMECERRVEQANEEASVFQRYTAMLEKAKAWKPPTPEHEGMRKFMIEQLESSLNFDCGFTPATVYQQTGEQWIFDQLETLHTRAAYHVKEYAAEVDRTRSRNEWIKALRESLKS